MAFHHLAGTTTQGAADPVVDWFATFEAWISAVVGWTIVAGAGTTDLVLMSTGEGAAYTRLYVRIWRDGITNHVRGEVRDDAAGTHKTTAGGYLDFPCRRRFWMSADLETIILIVPDETRDRILYLGTVDPVANNPLDETYHIIASDDVISTGFGTKILRNSAGLWNQNTTARDGGGAGQCQYDAMVNLPSLYVDWQNVNAGQWRYISGQLSTYMHATPGDELDTVVSGAASTWQVFSDGIWKFAVMTGGAEPGAVADGAAFAHQTGPCASAFAFITTILPAFMTGIGWADLGDVGVDSFCRLFHSTGESGSENVYVLVSYQQIGVNGFFYGYVQDDALGTHRISNVYTPMNNANFPCTYYMSADLDCLVFTHDSYFGNQLPLWVGKAAPFNPNLPDATYSMGAAARTLNRYAILRAHNGTWAVGGYLQEPTIFQNGNANAYDANTYVVAPHTLSSRLPGGGNINDYIGTLKYYFYTNGGGIAFADTITVLAETYMVFDGGAGSFWAMRTV